MIRATTYDETRRICGLIGFHPSECARGVAILEAESIGACVVFDYWTPNGVQGHVYAPRLDLLFSRTFLREVFTHIFIKSDRDVIVAITPGDQKGSLAVSSWLGFKEKYRVRDGWKPGVDMVLKELRRVDCRFLAQSVKSPQADARLN